MMIKMLCSLFVNIFTQFYMSYYTASYVRLIIINMVKKIKVYTYMILNFCIKLFYPHPLQKN